MSEEDFRDVRGSLGGHGCLGGAGAEEHYKARASVKDDGIGYTVHCDNCGQPNIVTPSWDELIYVANKQIPPHWKYEPAHVAVHPNVGCQMCRAVLLLLIKPDEASRQLKAGEHAGKVGRAYIVQASQRIAQRATAYGQ